MFMWVLLRERMDSIIRFLLGASMIKLNKTKVIGRRTYSNFQCGCGNIIELRSDASTKSCRKIGCIVSKNRSHGQSGTRLYNIWDGIKGRALHGNHASAKTYIDRGITLCEEWLEFDTFKTWAINNGYTDELTIDRKKINENYSPDNCQWVTRTENTKSQHADGHGHNTRVVLNDMSFISIAAAARYVSEFTSTKLKAIAAALEKRIKNNSNKPYKGFVISVDKGGKTL